MKQEPFKLAKLLSHLALGLGGSLLVLGGIYYATSVGGHDISPARLLQVLKSTSLSLFAAYVFTMLAGVLLRAIRYRILLRASGESNVPGFKEMTLITAVRNMTVDLLPARLGELVFVWLLNKRSGTKVSSGLSTLLFATLLDVMILAPLTIGIGLMVGFSNRQPYLLALIALFVVVGFVLGLRFILPLMMHWFERLATNTNAIIGGFFRFVLSVNEAVQTTMRAGVFNQVIVLTLVVRVMKYGGLLCLYYGLSQPSFPPLAELSGPKVLGAMIASEMSASLPIPTLMSFGTWEIGGMTLLAFYGAAPQSALMVMLAIHVQTQAMDYGLGLLALALLFLMVKSASRTPVTKGSRRTWVGAVFFVFSLVVAWFGIAAYKDKQSEFNQAALQATTRPADQALPAWVKGVKGRMVWSSNRSGNHDIMLMNLPDMSIRSLTTNPHTETFPRLSPDGQMVVFARSDKPWQSIRDVKPWSVWLLDIETGVEQKISTEGFSPSWSPDGGMIFYSRVGGLIMAYDLDRRQEHVHYQSGRDAFMKAQVEMSTPSVGQEGRLAFTFRDRGRPTNVVRNQEGQFMVVHSGACQVMWSPSGEFATYVQKGGRQTNQIMRFDPQTKTKTTLVDLSGEFSHEYFPRLSADEKVMVFAASAGGHEHDLADYEMFIWQVGSSSNEAVRLTFHSGNDSWPDVWLEGSSK